MQFVYTWYNNSDEFGVSLNIFDGDIYINNYALQISKPNIAWRSFCDARMGGSIFIQITQQSLPNTKLGAASRFSLIISLEAKWFEVISFSSISKYALIFRQIFTYLSNSKRFWKTIWQTFKMLCLCLCLVDLA